MIWPSELDSARTRAQGRKLPVSRAVKQPSLREVMEASVALGYSPQPSEKAALPRLYWDKTGYLLVKRMGQRSSMLKNIAGEIVKARQKESRTPDQKKR